jgi:hypothetical protein
MVRVIPPVCSNFRPGTVCVEVARGFYSSLFRQGGVRWSNREVAVALQEAIMSIRERDLRQLLNWAQFVHYGV